jgi:hypothetical protein
MPGPVPGIHVFKRLNKKDVDGRDKPGHDEKSDSFPRRYEGLEFAACISGQALRFRGLHGACRLWAISGCSGVRPPPEYRNNNACNHDVDPDADLYPVPDRRGISLSNPLRPVYEKPVQNIIVEVSDFSPDQAVP